MIMNLIHDICIIKNHINNIPKWRIITKHKYNKKLNAYISDFLNLDIYDLADNVISFLLCFGNETVYNNVNGMLQYSSVLLYTIIHNTEITYLPKSREFKIDTIDVTYTVGIKSKISGKINKMWEPLVNDIKKRYLEIIINMAEYLEN